MMTTCEGCKWFSHDESEDFWDRDGLCSRPDLIKLVGYDGKPVPVFGEGCKMWEAIE